MREKLIICFVRLLFFFELTFSCFVLLVDYY